MFRLELINIQTNIVTMAHMLNRVENVARKC